MSEATPAIIVDKTSPVTDKHSYLHHWDTAVRKNHTKIEVFLSNLKEGVQGLYKNPLTSFKDPIQFGHRYHQIQILEAAQQLGTITSDEVQDANHALGGTYKVIRTPSSKSPLYALNVPVLGGLYAFSNALMVYSLFVKRFNILWVAGSFVPFWTAFFYFHLRQPKQHLINCYNYIHATRQATVELEKKHKEFDSLPFTNLQAYKTLRSHLGSSHKTLYHLENEIRDAIDQGSF